MDQPDNNIEIWKPVVGWEGVYEVSNLGRFKRITILPNHPYPRLLKACPWKDGYLLVRFFQKGRRPKSSMAHCIVAAAFIGPRPPGKEINHRNGCKADNAVANLEYVTHSENIRHAFKAGLSVGRPGRTISMSRLSEEQVREIKSLFGHMSQKAIARRFSVSPATISLIRSGKTWRHTSAP